MNESKYRPVFSAYMRKLDPLLQAEESNPLFEAFRLRRTLYRPGVVSRLKRLEITARYLLTILLWLLLAASSTAAIYFFRTAGVLFSLVCLLVFSSTYLRIRRSSKYMPRWLGQVFAPSGVLTQQARDIWLTGNDGQTVAVALYLEARERQRVPILLAAVAIFLAPIICSPRAISFFTKVSHPFVSLQNLVIVLCSVPFALASWRVLWSNGIEAAVYEGVVARFTVFSKKSLGLAYGSLIGMRVKGMVKIVSFVGTLIILSLCLPCATVDLIEVFFKSDPGAFGKAMYSNRPYFGVYVLLLQLSVFIYVLELILRRQIHDRCEFAMRSAKRPYREFMVELTDQLGDH